MSVLIEVTRVLAQAGQAGLSFGFDVDHIKQQMPTTGMTTHELLGRCLSSAGKGLGAGTLN